MDFTAFTLFTNYKTEDLPAYWRLSPVNYIHLERELGKVVTSKGFQVGVE
jgi:hypothetical protein